MVFIGTKYLSWLGVGLVISSNPGRGILVSTWERQFIPYCFSLPSWVPSINKAVLRACALYAASCSGMVSVCTGLLGEEGRVSASVDTRL